MIRSRHAVFGLGLTLVSLLPFSAALADTPTAARQAQLEHLLVQDCGSCHGLRMTGGLGPALTRDAIADKPRDALIATVTHGRGYSGAAGGAMSRTALPLDSSRRARA